MNKKICFVFAALISIPASLLAQDKSAMPAAAPANPITVSEKGLYSFLSGNAVAAAQKMPEENYAFKPTPDVRSFGQIVGHLADASYMFCSQAAGDTVAPKNIEKTKTSKADLVAALKDSVAYCTKSFDGMTDAKGGEMIELFNFNMARLAVFSLNTAHTNEHYGNMVTYMRIKGLVPPSSENQPPPMAK